MGKPIHRSPSAARLPAATWRKSTHSGQIGNCVEAAALDGGDVALRNSRYPSGPALIFSRDEVAAFLAGTKGGEFDDVPSSGEILEPNTRTTSATWLTCEFDRTDHAISDDNMAVGFSVAGRYLALCGTTVGVSPLVCPPGRRCLSCEAIVQRTDRESLPRETEVLNQSFGSGRHREGTTGR